MKTHIQTAVIILGAALFCAGLAQRSAAATTNVLIAPSFSLTFSPSVVSISVNDSVVWNWQSTFHSTTSGTNGVAGDDNGVPSGLWDSGIITSTPYSFTNTFTSPGVFSYYCSEHYFYGMTGAVVVANSAGPLPPSLAITNPANGAVLAAPANITVQVTVTNGSGAVTNVQFFINSHPFATASSSPFSGVTNNLPAGPYTFSAVALDNNGLRATNSVAITVVAPTTVSMGGSAHVSDTHFQFTYSADIGLSYVVQRSTDMINWIPVITNKATSNPALFDDPNATNALDYYRVGRLPNP